MKKIILFLSLTLIAFSGHSQLATLLQQQTQTVKLDTANARLLRGANYNGGGATAIRQDTSNARLLSLRNYGGTQSTAIRQDTSNTRLLSLRNYGGTQSTAIRQDTSNARLLTIKNSLFDQLSGANVTDQLATLLTNLAALSPTLAVGTNYVGQIGQTQDKIQNTVTTSAAPAYSSGDNIGGIITITNALRLSGGTATLNDFSVWDKSNQKAAVTLDFWDASPSGTYTDNAAQVIAGDQAKWLGSVSVSADDYITQGAVARGTIKNIGLILQGNASRNIFVTMATTSTPTYGSTSDLIIMFGIDQN